MSIMANIDTLPHIQITNPTTLQQATEYLSQANKYLDTLTKDKETMTRPLNEALRTIRAKYKPTEDKLNDIIATIRQALMAYQTEQTALQQKKEQKVIDQLNANKITTEKAVQKIEKIAVTGPAVKTTTLSGSVTFRPTQTLTILDPLLIPREYLIPDTALLLIKLKEGVIIPGAKITVIQVPVNRKN